jgi:hypothetical protein
VAGAAICIAVAGIVRATIPVSEFTLAWDHSVEKTRWEERYRGDGTRLSLVEARVQGLGAGMEPPGGATLSSGWWSWKPELAPLAELRLTYSTFTRDYTLCTRQRCATLRALVGVEPAQGAAVDVRVC